MGFSSVHIAITAAIVAAVAVPIAAAILRPTSWTGIGTAAAVAGLTTLGWRLAAHVDALNTDGVPWVSANDALAGAITYLTLDMYATIRPPQHPARYARLQVALAAAALVVNVVVI